ncbi:hypothetical protein BI364_09050 [Acidihalobacter yilgarnensis]|uniref:Uncharacterized protein n=1 Tax=Acidihalobacter yilgarnensis TaxID=2819280 RepID=A0A1D8INN0_9GAMM|nr:hypothetical protein [Acidihalobacter yilgarnensis]AOU98088.1 hypothetical protein BI364_09050 [Acidihalobacter yilgarnensis]
MSGRPQKRTYIGIDQDKFGGMTPTGAIVKDAWIFGLLQETEDTCAGWDAGRMQILYDKTSELWAQYHYRVEALPEDIRARHERIHREAMARARALGWAPDSMIEEDES